MNDVLKIEQRGHTHILTLSRPEKMNALSGELVEALLAALADAERDQARVVVLQGEGRNFSAGFDFSGFEVLSEGDLLMRFVRIEMLLQAVAQSPCLTVALAHGRNFGAGVDLIAACQQRHATDGTTFRMPGLKFGLILGTRRFAALVGAQRARDILACAQTFGTEDALRDGFLSGVTPQTEWETVVAQALETASALPDSVRAQLFGVLAGSTANDDLADLVRSAARPGIKNRITHYLAASSPAAATNKERT